MMEGDSDSTLRRYLVVAFKQIVFAVPYVHI